MQAKLARQRSIAVKSRGISSDFAQPTFVQSRPLMANSVNARAANPDTRRSGSLLCYAIKWGFAASYLFLLAMNTWGLLSAEHLLLSLGLPWTLFLDPLGKINSLIGVSPALLTMLTPAH